jgi:DNA-binding NarL/FixJ family response regulator
MSIFVIDDHPLMREAIGGLIRRLRPSAKVVEIERMSNMAKMVAEHGEAELVCLDLKMPDTNGVSAVREIRQLMPDTVIVVVSASSASDYAELTREVGADAYVEKSAGAQEIGRVLRDYLTEEGPRLLQLPPEEAQAEISRVTKFKRDRAAAAAVR